MADETTTPDEQPTDVEAATPTTDEAAPASLNDVVVGCVMLPAEMLARGALPTNDELKAYFEPADYRQVANKIWSLGEWCQDFARHLSRR